MKKVLIVACAILYVLSPIDVIPDFLLGPGQLDDAAVFALALRHLFAESS
jgi:uncharacterized membrane protein YkvA (DUF1232 family)